MKYLSICIPTYQRIEITRNTIASIYADLEGVDLGEFEVIVSDNDTAETTRCFEKEFPYENFHYYQTKCEGFLNSFHVLGYGEGLFLKLHNNYTQLKPGSLKYLIDEIKHYADVKPLMFFTNGLRHFKEKREFTSFDAYMYDMSYFSSWSTGFGIWKEDYDRIKGNVEINKWFPQTSMLLPFYDKKQFVLNDLVIFDDQKVPKKGGYNPYYVFGVDYVSLVKRSFEVGNISLRTFEKIKKDILCEYLSSRYFKTVMARMDKFDHSDIKKHLSVHYSKGAYYKMLAYALLAPFKYYINK